MSLPMRDDLLSALALLTRLPLPAHRPVGAGSAWAWPLAGLLVGGLGATALALGEFCGIAPGPQAALALAVMALTTGALHEDGLSDTADGLLGGQTPARRLEIMKDSRIGSFGALALLLVTLASWSALTGLIEAGRATPALIAAAALSRAPMAVLMAALPPARPNGLSSAMGRPTAEAAALAAALGLLVALVLCRSAALPAAVGVALISLLLARAALARIGGQTGDILGASQQLAFAVALSLLA